MSIDTLNACMEGYNDRLFDQQLLTAHIGFWSGYYNNSKHPKPLNSVLTSMLKSKNKKNQKHVDTVNVAEFLEKEQKFKEQLNKGVTYGSE